MAWGTLAVSCIHGAVYVTQWALAWAEGAGSYREVAWKLTDRNVTGLLALAAALAIGATSFAWVRTHHYRVSPCSRADWWWGRGKEDEPVGGFQMHASGHPSYQTFTSFTWAQAHHHRVRPRGREGVGTCSIAFLRLLNAHVGEFLTSV